MQKLIKKYSGALMALAVVVATYSANTMCVYYLNQPKVPDAVKKLRKF